MATLALVRWRDAARFDERRHVIVFLRALPRLIVAASREWVADNAPRLSAAIAFYTLLSLAPVIVIAVAAAAALYGQRAAHVRLASAMEGLAGPDVARVIQEISRGASQPRAGLIATLLGLVLLALGASSVFVELHDALNRIWGVPEPSDRNHAATIFRLVKDRVISFATVLGAGFLLLTSLVLDAGIEALQISVPRAVTFFASYLVIAILFAALYKTAPDVAVRWRDVAPGAAITSLLFMLGTQFAGLYFANANFGATYSAVGSPVVVLLWIYYSAQLFFWGAEFTKVYVQTFGRQSAA